MYWIKVWNCIKLDRIELKQNNKILFDWIKLKQKKELH